MEIYNSQQIEEKIKSLSGWLFINDAIEKQYKFKDFKQALAFIVHVGLYAEQADHHPEIINVYNKVTLRLNTHSVKGITDKDFALAEKIENAGQ